jgi:erythromycin esterase-like protein
VIYIKKLASTMVAAMTLFSCKAPATSAAPAAATANSAEALAAIRAAAIPITGAAQDHDALIRSAQRATRILLGEATHGTHEFYRERARISMRLIREAGVNAIAIEGDWSPTYRVNLYVRGLGRDRSAREALRSYTRFPLWMWPNSEFAEFVDQLRAYNLALPANQRVGLYGMDVYDLFEAAESVVESLGNFDRAAAQRARAQYRCFGRYGRNTHTYGEAARRPAASCQQEAEAVVAEMRRIPRPSDPGAAEAHFAAARAAASVAAAEAYFRTVYNGANAWNVRDERMAETVEAIAEHVQRLTGRPGKLAMWSHNTHSGDARATFAAAQGELNIGQLMKQRHGDRAYLVGFFTHSGKVLAAPQWDSPGRVYDLRPALPESYSGLFNRSGIPAFTLVMKDNPQLAAHFSRPMLERAVGVVYAPHAERQSHYFDAVLARQFDAAIFFAKSQEVRPL